MQAVQVCSSIQSEETHDEGTQCRNDKVSPFPAAACLDRCCRAKPDPGQHCHYSPFLQLHRNSVIGGQHICSEGHCSTLMLGAGCCTASVSVSCLHTGLWLLPDRPCGQASWRGLALLKAHRRVNTWVLGLCDVTD